MEKADAVSAASATHEPGAKAAARPFPYNGFVTVLQGVAVGVLLFLWSGQPRAAVAMAHTMFLVNLLFAMLVRWRPYTRPGAAWLAGWLLGDMMVVFMLGQAYAVWHSPPAGTPFPLQGVTLLGLFSWGVMVTATRVHMLWTARPGEMPCGGIFPAAARPPARGALRRFIGF